MIPELRHDVAFATALAILDVVKPRLRRNEWRTAFDQFYRTCRASLDAYEIQKARVENEPSKN